MLSIIYLAVPACLATMSIWWLRGVWRITAIGCLLIMLPAFVRDMIGVARGGNLAGIYTLMLMKPALLFLLVVHGTSFLTQRLQRLENIKQRYAMAVLSSCLLSGVSLYVWTWPVLFPLGLQLDEVPYWIVGSLLALAAGYSSFRVRNTEGSAE